MSTIFQVAPNWPGFSGVKNLVILYVHNLTFLNFRIQLILHIL